MLTDDTAGDPMRQDRNWTPLRWDQSADRLAEAGTPVSVTVVKQRLRQHGDVKRQTRQSRSMGEPADRNRQFETIARLKPESLGSAKPILSLDTTKKELVGHFSREGRRDARETIATFDHDFPRAASGVLIPHGRYAVKRNDGHGNLGTSHDPRAFACDSIGRWWESRGRAFAPRAPSLRLVGDGGGSPRARQSLFQEDLQRRVDRIGIAIRGAHSPPSTSKDNPIEHRLFPHLTRACPGVIFAGVALVKELMERAKTSTGLRVTVAILDKVYRTGRKDAEGFKENRKIVFDEILPKGNYRVIRSGT